MTVIDDVSALFRQMLKQFKRGISNTSTNKYDPLREFLGSNLGLSKEEVYVTGAADRMSNLDTRLPQGNNKNQHIPLAVAFVRQELKGRPRKEVTEKARQSFASTCAKFVSGEERGTNFDGVLGFLQIGDEPKVEPLKFIYTENCPYRQQVLKAFPGVPEQRIARAARPSAAPPALETVPPVAKQPTPHSSSIDASLIDRFEADVKAAGLSLPRELLVRFVAALLTKRFVILAGLSGSGKTQLALAFSRWLQESETQVSVVAVGADWTSNENVLGYRDALDTTQYRRPSSGALDLILRAKEDPSRPYFLILDEMNLSHVERYFADLLSAIESGAPVALHAGPQDVDGVPPRIPLPGNLFVFGTVNVDETTYMFSPKVLDRANVIEFRPTAADIRAFLSNPTPVDLSTLISGGSSLGQLLITEASTAGDRLDVLPVEIDDGSAVRRSVEEHLTALFELLSPIGGEFGFRTAIEVCRFVYFHALLVGPGWQSSSAIDAQIVQKLMPKLHGSERRLRPVLNVLAQYAEDHGLPLTAEKTRRMGERLREGFASFLE